MLATTIALAGCGGASVAPPAPTAATGNVTPLRPLAARDAHARRGIYVSEVFGSSILGYSTDNRDNEPPFCSEGGISYASAVAVDANGNLMVPNAGRSVVVFKGPKMCGPELGSISDPYGIPGDLASNDAVNAPIAVATGSSGVGSIAICTLAAGCTKSLTNPNMGEVAGVAMAPNGDCWASAAFSNGTATLTYFRHCSGAGKAATGFKNAYSGGLDIDIHGNLVSIDAFAPALWIYRGCNPHCTVVGGPFALHGYAVYGHLNEGSTEFAAADYACGCIDVYDGSIKKGLIYKYSFSNGLSASDDVEGVAYNPRSKE